MTSKNAKNCDLVVFGETTLDTISHVDSLPLPESPAGKIESFQGPSVGGRGANAGTYAAAFGVQVSLLSACGNDYLDRYAQINMSGKVKTEHIFKSSDKLATARAWVYRDKSRALTFFHPGALRAHEDEYKKRLRLSYRQLRPRAVYCTSELHGMVEEILHHYQSTKAVLKAFAPGPEVGEIPTEPLKRILRLSDIVFVNLAEKKNIEARLNCSLHELIESYRLKAIVVTFAEAGALLVRRDGKSTLSSFLHSYPVSQKKYKDSTGAGDALAGAFLGSFLSAKASDLLSALKYGVAVSSLVVETFGCMVDGLSITTIDTRLSEYEKRLKGMTL